MSNSASEELQIISNVLTNKEFGNLLPEILWSAFNFMSEVPDATIEESIEFGINEWIK